MNHKCTKWVLGGSALFVVENVLLSENRSRIIGWVGDKHYHSIFSTTSSAAVLSVVYGYWRHGPGPNLGKLPLPLSLAGAGFIVLGAGLLSQLPAFDRLRKNAKENCPVPTGDPDEIQGVFRVTRHPMLYGVGFLGLGMALRSPYAGRRALFASPMGISFLGTHHQDSRYRRGIGGTLSKARDEATSNIPFAALLLGRQSWPDMWNELDQERLAIAVAVSTPLIGLSLIRLRART